MKILSAFGTFVTIENRCYIRSNSRQHNTTDFSVTADKARHDKLVSLVEQMLDLHKRKASADAASQERLSRLISATDKQIDALVYELYELTKEEIAVMDGR